MADVKLYVMHITQNNKMEDLMKYEVIEIIKKYAIGMAQNCKDPIKYIATVLFNDAEKRAECCLEFKKIGIDIQPDKEFAYVDEKYLKGV